MKARISGDSGMKGIRGVAWLAAAVAVQGAGAQAEPVSETVFQYRAWEVQAVAFDDGSTSCVAQVSDESDSFSIWADGSGAIKLQLNTLNPSVLLFWLINATAFAVTHSFRDRVLIFTVCMVFNMLADALKVLLAGKLRKKLTLHNLSLVNKISGVILVGFGIALLWGIAFHLENV